MIEEVIARNIFEKLYQTGKISEKMHEIGRIFLEEKITESEAEITMKGEG